MKKSKFQKSHWDSRSTGLNKSLRKLNAKRRKSVKNLEDLVSYLTRYQDKLYSFFLSGFSNFFEQEEEHIRLIPSDKYPPEYVLQKILSQASFDLALLQRAVSLRRDEEFGEKLDEFDKYAELAVLFAKDLIDPIKPFVYFQQDTSVRIMPYANALLIGVPYSAMSHYPDLLSIPHEVGHHVFQKGKLKSEPIDLILKKYFTNRPLWIQNWLEEIFADLYGFLVAGPIVALSAQDIMLDNLPQDLLEDDGIHPVGTLRPFVYIKILELIKTEQVGKEKQGEYQGLIDALEDRWDEKRRQIGIGNTFRPKGTDKEIKESAAKAQIYRVVSEMYQLLKEANDAFIFSTDKNWAEIDGLWNQPEKLYGKLVKVSEQAANFSKEYKKGKRLDIQVSKKFKDEFLKSNFSLEKNNQFWLYGQIEYWENLAKNKELPPLNPNIWELIFTAFGWADRGDDTRPVHGPE